MLPSFQLPMMTGSCAPPPSSMTGAWLLGTSARARQHCIVKLNSRSHMTPDCVVELTSQETEAIKNEDSHGIFGDSPSLQLFSLQSLPTWGGGPSETTGRGLLRLGGLSFGVGLGLAIRLWLNPCVSTGPGGE